MGRPPKVKTPLGHRLLQIRGGEKRADFCRDVGISERTFGDYERGDSLPDAETLNKLAKYRNINLNWLITGEGEMFGSSDLRKKFAKEFNLDEQKIAHLTDDEVIERCLRGEEAKFTQSPIFVQARPALATKTTNKIDPTLFETIAKKIFEEHQKHGLKLAPIVLTVETAKIYNNIASRVVDMNDKAAVEAMIPVVIKELGEQLKEAETDPGTGKHLA